MSLGSPSRSPRTSRTLRARLTALAVAATVLTVGAPAASASLDPGAPSGSGGARVAQRGDVYVETRLMFGTERPDGGPAVTDRQFMAFVDREVTPRFPEGLTVQSGRGQWRDAQGRVERERSYELILLYPARTAPARDAQVERIRAAYVRAYGQEAVARIDDSVSVDF